MYGRGKWVWISEVGNYSPELNQEIFIEMNPTFPLDMIKQVWSRGKMVQELFYKDKQWVLLVVQRKDNNPGNRQTLDTSPKFPLQAIQRAWRMNKAVTFLHYLNQMWRVVTEDRTGDVKQSITLRAKLPLNELHSIWSQDHHVSRLTYGNGRWAIISCI